MRLCSQCCAPWRSPWHRHTRAWHLPEQIEAPTQIHCWLQHLTSRVWEWTHHNEICATPGIASKADLATSIWVDSASDAVSIHINPSNPRKIFSCDKMIQPHNLSRCAKGQADSSWIQSLIQFCGCGTWFLRLTNKKHINYQTKFQYFSLPLSLSL